MVKIIQDLWVLKEGLVMFKRVYDEKLNSDLFGALMTALKFMGDKIGLKRGLSSFQVDNKKYFLAKRDDVLFIANGDRNAKEKKMLEELNNIRDIFYETYGESIIKEWKGGDVSGFEDFTEKIQFSLKEAIDRFKSVYG